MTQPGVNGQCKKAPGEVRFPCIFPQPFIFYLCSSKKAGQNLSNKKQEN